MCNALIRAQTSQIDGLDALRRYLETGESSDLTAAAGARAATSRALRELERDQYEYLSKHHLTGGRSPANP
jgi:hypothetical protein